MDSTNDIFRKWLKFFNDLSLGRKLGLTGFVLAFIFSFIGIIYWVQDKSQVTFQTHLTPEDSVRVIQFLQKNKVPFVAENHGETIKIPPELVAPMNMKFAKEGFTKGNVVGFEIFEKGSFGVTSFIQKINYKRALQGELARTIDQIKGVERSRVHLTIPEKGVFTEDYIPPKASVILEVSPGLGLTPEDVSGILSLVSAAVDGLSNDNIAVMDTSGKVYHSNSDSVEGKALNHQLEYQAQIEKALESKVLKVLNNIVGDGRVTAKVNANIDYNQQSSYEEEYNPEKSAVVQSNSTEDNSQGSKPMTEGIPGSRNLIPGAPEPPAVRAPAATETASKVKNSNTYDTGKKIVRQAQVPGRIKKLTIAVLLDDAWLMNEPNGDEAGSSPADKSKPAKKPKLTPEAIIKIKKDKINSVTELVKNIVGYESGRDTISIEAMPFVREKLGDADEALATLEKRQMLYSLITYAAFSVLILFLFIFVIRPFIKWLTEQTTEEIKDVLPQTISELEELQNNNQELLGGLESLPVLEEKIDLDKAEGELIKEKILSIIDNMPKKAAQVITEWIAEDLARKEKKDKKDQIEMA